MDRGDAARALNAGLLPQGYYALAEQVANDIIPDVLTLQDLDSPVAGGEGNGRELDGSSGVALAEAVPRWSRESIGEAMLLAAKRRRLVIRHATGDRIVALIEIISPGNKESRAALNLFVDKAVGALGAGYHLLLLDLFPPGAFRSRRHSWRSVAAARRNLHTAARQTADPGGLRSRGNRELLCRADLRRRASDPNAAVLIPGITSMCHLSKPTLASYEGVPGRWKRVIEDAG